jgi:virulence-associated protein VapD
MVSPSTIIPSIQILALEVYFKVRNELKTLPSFLKCFRNVEMFHVKVSVSNFLLLSDILHSWSADLQA